MPDTAIPGDCLLCDMEQAAGTATVFRDPLWAAEVVPGFEVPGWFVLRARRHAVRMTGLSEAELIALPHRARDLVAAVTEVTGATATYFLVFGENYPHFHALIAARGDDVPQDRRSGDILKLRAERADAAAAAHLVPAVRRTYERIAAGHMPAGAPR